MHAIRPTASLLHWIITLGWLAGCIVVAGAASATERGARGTLSTDLAITLDDGVSTAIPGAPVTYVVEVTNGGPASIANATVVDTFPAVCQVPQWSCSGTGGAACPATGSGDINAVVSLPVGSTVRFLALCVIDSTATGTLTNSANVALPAGWSDPQPANNTATDNDVLVPQANLLIAKDNGDSVVRPGTTTTYTIIAKNAGPSFAAGAMVTDVVPATCTNPVWTCVDGPVVPACVTPVGGRVDQAVNLNNMFQSRTFRLTCTIPLNAFGTVSNTATITSPAGLPDPQSADNSATDTDTVLAGASVSSFKHVQGDFVPNGNIRYTVQLYNTGIGPQLDNPGDEFIDPLPVGITFRSVSATSGVATYDATMNTIRWNGALLDIGVNIEIAATINGDAGGPISNQGTARFDSNGDGSNESSSPTADVVRGSGPTVFVVSQAVPALGRLATLLLAIALVTTALLRRRHAFIRGD